MASALFAGRPPRDGSSELDCLPVVNSLVFIEFLI